MTWHAEQVAAFLFFLGVVIIAALFAAMTGTCGITALCKDGEATNADARLLIEFREGVLVRGHFKDPRRCPVTFQAEQVANFLVCGGIGGFAILNMGTSADGAPNAFTAAAITI